MYYLIGYGAIGREAKRILLPCRALFLANHYEDRNRYDKKFPVKGDVFDKIYKYCGISLDRLIFDWYIEWKD